MAFIPAPNTYKAVHSHTVQGQECLVIRHFTLAGVAFEVEETQELANDLFTAWATHVVPNIAAENTFNSVQVTYIGIPDGPQATSTNAPVVGGSANPSLSNALAPVISLRTASSGRNARGRMYIPGVRGDLVATDSNYFTAPFVAELQADCTALLAAWRAIMIETGPDTLVPVIASFYDGTDPVTKEPIPRAAAVTFPILSVNARSRIATQRRRRPRS